MSQAVVAPSQRSLITILVNPNHFYTPPLYPIKFPQQTIIFHFPGFSETFFQLNRLVNSSFRDTKGHEPL